jgi:hypothetical protein
MPLHMADGNERWAGRLRLAGAGECRDHDQADKNTFISFTPPVLAPQRIRAPHIPDNR